MAKGKVFKESLLFYGNCWNNYRVVSNAFLRSRIGGGILKETQTYILKENITTTEMTVQIITYPRH